MVSELEFSEKEGKMGSNVPSEVAGRLQEIEKALIPWGTVEDWLAEYNREGARPWELQVYEDSGEITYLAKALIRSVRQTLDSMKIIIYNHVGSSANLIDLPGWPKVKVYWDEAVPHICSAIRELASL